MTFQIRLVSTLEEGPVRTHTVVLPTAYETAALAYKLADRMIEAGWADSAEVVVWGTRTAPRSKRSIAFEDDIVF